MNWLIWTIGAVLAAIWTGAFAIVGSLIDWAGKALGDLGGTSLPSVPVSANVPDWLASWIGPAQWTALAQSAQQALQWVQPMLPAVGTATGWLEPLIWIVWSLGMLALLAVAAGSHWLANKRAAPSSRMAT